MKNIWAKIKGFFNKYSYMKWLAPLLAVAVVATAIVLPISLKKPEQKEVTKLSFKSAAEYDYLKTLDGTMVTINGYMATSSPVDGSFMFLMNMPYQSCPFCLPNTSTLSNTMEVYPKKGEAFDYTTQAIKVVGTLEVAENEDEPFSDEYGYEFNYKIVDATYTILKSEELSADLALWQKVAESGIINEIDQMYNFVNFTCKWNTYYVNSYYDKDGKLQPGYYLYASDAEYYLFTDGAQWNFGTKEDYFDNIIAKITAIHETAFQELVDNIRQAEALAAKAIAELKNGKYTFELQYVEMFGKEDYIYKLDIGEELVAEMNLLYKGFSNWLGSWEM
ncbi:MAG: hypothetical protein E7349_05775 [Clostridiales bacterium]|nr:hypothetical protein [Clostridiales bacterium]